MKTIGFFKISKFLKKNQLIIIAYHGIALEDQHVFNNKLFIRSETFEKRMKYLKNENFNILSLDNALKKLKNKSLPHNAVVITFDDGWHSTLLAHKILKNYCFEYTIYISSYYAMKNISVLNVMLKYIIWKSSIDDNKIDLKLLKNAGLNEIFLNNNVDDKKIIYSLILDHFNSLGTTTAKLHFVKDVSKLLNISFDEIDNKKLFKLLSISDIEYILTEGGVDIQLHTHRHKIEVGNEEQIKKEILDNLKCLQKFIGNKPIHFCYPSGVYSNKCWFALKCCGVTSATTCTPGFVNKNTNIYYLPRFLDGENIHQVNYEAEVCGFSDSVRKIKSFFKYNF